MLCNVETHSYICNGAPLTGANSKNTISSCVSIIAMHPQCNAMASAMPIVPYRPLTRAIALEQQTFVA